jgi:hypothetical protein
MTTRGLWAGLTILLLAATAGLSADLDFRRHQAVQESLSRVPPRLRSQWLRQRGMDTPFLQPSKADSAGIQVVGRWSYGPAYDVDGRITPSETLIALGRGSGVSLLRVWRGDSLHSELLSDINAERLLNKVMVRDTLLYVGTNAGLETYDISDEHNPVRLSWIQTGLAGFDIKDTLAYVTWSDTFKIYSIANPANPYRVGWCRDSAADVSVAGSTAFLADRWGMYTVDVSNPASPHRLGSWGSDIMSVAARNDLCYVSVGNPNVPEQIDLYVLDVANPGSPQQIGHLADAGGFDIYLDDTVAFISGYSATGRGFQEISIADSTHPRFIATCSTPGAYGVWASATGGMAMLANYTAGLLPVDVTNPSLPVFGNNLLTACWTDDLDVAGGYAYLANLGLKVLDLSNVARPVEVGHVDSARLAQSVAVDDSFAFVEWHSDFSVASALVSDPAHPTLTGRAPLVNSAEDMVLRDSFLYVAEDYKFQIVNVARPRQPQVVGTCNLGNLTYGMRMCDSLAYVCSYPLAIINTANPTSPVQIGSIPHGAWNVFPKDSLACIAAVGLVVWNVSDPASPFAVDSLQFGRMVYDVLLRDTVAYLACSDGLRTASVADVHNMRVTGYAPLPYVGWRLADDSVHIYVAVEEAGVCIFDTVSTGVSEPKTGGSWRSFTASPRVTTGRIRITTGAAAADAPLTVYDVNGQMVATTDVKGGMTELDISACPDGVYVVRVQDATGVYSAKVVKTRR